MCLTGCVKCGSSTPPIHALRNGTLRYCSDCLIAATRKRTRLALLSALSPRSLDLGCRLAVAVSSPRPDGSSSWCAWTLLKRHMQYHTKAHGRRGLDVEAVHVRFDGGDGIDGGDDIDGIGDTVDLGSVDRHDGYQNQARIVTLDGAVLATVEDPTGREDLRRVLVRHALARELQGGDVDCIVMGDTADALAASAVSRAVKGQGHLLGDVGRPRDGFAFVMRDLGKDWVAACHRAFVTLEQGERGERGEQGERGERGERGEQGEQGERAPESEADGKRVEGRAVVSSGGGSGSIAECQRLAPSSASETNEKNLNDLSRSFAAQLLRSNPGGVSNILATAAKLEGSCSHRGDHPACGLCGEALADGEEGNRAGVCDACTTGVFSDWRDEARAARTMALLPADMRSRLVSGESTPSLFPGM